MGAGLFHRALNEIDDSFSRHRSQRFVCRAEERYRFRSTIQAQEFAPRRNEISMGSFSNATPPLGGGNQNTLAFSPEGFARICQIPCRNRRVFRKCSKQKIVMPRKQCPVPFFKKDLLRLSDSLFLIDPPIHLVVPSQ